MVHLHPHYNFTLNLWWREVLLLSMCGYVLWIRWVWLKFVSKTDECHEDRDDVSLVAKRMAVWHVRMNGRPKIYSAKNKSCSNSTMICGTALVEIHENSCVLIDGATSNTRSISDSKLHCALRLFRSLFSPKHLVKNCLQQYWVCILGFDNLPLGSRSFSAQSVFFLISGLLCGQTDPPVASVCMTWFTSSRFYKAVKTKLLTQGAQNSCENTFLQLLRMVSNW